MRDLIERIARGDEAALGELYDCASSLVHGLCLRIVRDESTAEEVTLDVFLQVWNQAAAYDPSRGTSEAWLLVIARSRSLDQLRSARARREREYADVEALSDLAADAGSVPCADPIANGDRRRIVANALDKVSREEREVLGCAFFSGMSHSEIAEFLKQPLGTVKSRIRSGLMKLRRMLAPLAAGGVAW